MPSLNYEAPTDDNRSEQSESTAILINSENSLEIFFNYLIKEKSTNPIPFDKWQKIATATEIMGGSGGIYTWPAAMHYAKDFAPWLRYSFAITNPLSTTLFLIKATDDLTDTIRAEVKIPDELKDLILIKSKSSLIAKYLKIGFGSLVCVIPFGIMVYMFPLPDCNKPWCLGLTVSHATITNTILHGVSWSLIFTPNFWYYRLPLIPFEKAYALIKSSLKSKAEIQLAKLNNLEEKIYAKYHKILINTLTLATNNLVKDHLRGNQEVSNFLRSLSNDNISLISFAKFAKNSELDNSNLSPFRTCTNKLHAILANGPIGFIGASIMVVGCIGWIANAYYVANQEGLNIAQTIAAGSLPAYSTAVLCAFYGAGIFNQIFHYLTSWDGSIKDKLSLEARMYPKTFIFFTLINLYISAFAYASGVALIDTIFKDPEFNHLRPVLKWISIPTLQLLSFIPLIELFNVIVRKSVAKFGALESDNTIIARLMLKLSLISHYLLHMKGEKLIESIGQYRVEEQCMLGIDPVEFSKDLTYLEENKQIKEQLTMPHSPQSLGSSNQFKFFGSATRELNQERMPLIPRGN